MNNKMYSTRNVQLPLMPLPAKVTIKEVEPNIRCGYCGGSEPSKGERAVYVNGIRVHPLHKACVKSASRPLFDMDAKLWQEKA